MFICSCVFCLFDETLVASLILTFALFKTAAQYGSLYIIRKLLHYNVDIDARSNDQRAWSALHFAVFGDQAQAVQLLIGRSFITINAVLWLILLQNWAQMQMCEVHAIGLRCIRYRSQSS